MKVPALDMARLDGLPVPVATRDELRRRSLMAAEACGERLLLAWNGGRPRAWRDACPHLGLPLTMGRRERANVRCAYHGWAFDLDSGEVREQPTLRRPAPCRLQRRGALLRGGLVFAWRGDPGPDGEALAAAALPEEVPERFALHRVEFHAPYYLALWNAVDYAHFARHRGYSLAYAAYRRLRRGAPPHVPGEPFHWEPAGEDGRSLRFRIPEAGRDLRLFAAAAEFGDEGGVNGFHTFVTPLSPCRTLYWECYRPRTGSPVAAALARLAFRATVVPLLDTEDQDWTSRAAPAFLRGENIHLSETDLPLGAHLRRFVLPRFGGDSAPAANEAAA